MKFSLFGIPVHVQPMFWLVALLLGAPKDTSPRSFATLASWIALLFISILAHELGHAFAMRAYGRHPRIELWGLGGLTHWGNGPSASPRADIIVSLAGPFAGFALGAIVFALARFAPPEAGTFAEDVVIQALWINVGWGLVNLIPVLPLDGGHVLEATAGWFGGARGRRFAAGVSLVIAVSIVVWAVSTGQLWIGFLGLWCASISWRRLSAKLPLAGPAEPLPDWVEAGLSEAWSQLQAGRAGEALGSAQALLRRLPAEGHPTEAQRGILETIAWANIELGDDRAAIDAAKAMPGGPSDLLRGRLEVMAGKIDEGLLRLEEAFKHDRNSFPALVLSSVYVENERPDLTVKMLRSERGARLSAKTHLTLSAQLFGANLFDLAFEASTLGFERFGSGTFAYNAACSLSRLGRADEGIDWLERAVGAGFSDAEAFDHDGDIASLREHPRFGVVRSAIPS